MGIPIGDQHAMKSGGFGEEFRDDAGAVDPAIRRQRVVGQPVLHLRKSLVRPPAVQTARHHLTRPSLIARSASNRMPRGCKFGPLVLHKNASPPGEIPANPRMSVKELNRCREARRIVSAGESCSDAIADRTANPVFPTGLKQRYAYAQSPVCNDGPTFEARYPFQTGS